MRVLHPTWQAWQVSRAEPRFYLGPVVYTTDTVMYPVFPGKKERKEKAVVCRLYVRTVTSVNYNNGHCQSSLPLPSDQLI